MKIHELLDRFGSPAYVYDLAELRAAYAALRRSLPEPSVVYYSLKANPHPTLVAALQRLGCRAEVSSIGELTAALDSGVGPERCLYSGPGKTMRELVFALERGVTHVGVDSPADLRNVAAAAEQCGRPVQVVLRVNPDRAVANLGLTMTGGPSQFGADAEWIRSAPGEFAGTRWARVVGFHIYMGTNIAATATLLQTFDVASSLAVELAEALGIELELVDLGGGFGQPFANAQPRYDFSDLRAPLTAMLDERLPGWRAGRPQVAFESGRYLVGGSGALYCTVQDVKRSQGRPFVILDSGINHLGGMAGLRRVPRIGAQLVGVDADASRPIMQQANIVGPLCTPLDYLAQGADLPELHPGDIVAIRNVGAYGLTGSLIAFLSHPPAVEIVLDDDDVIHASQLTLVRQAR